VIAYFRFALVAMLLAGISCLSAIITMQFAVHRTVVTVPELQGETVAEAVSRAARMGLDVSVSRRFYSAVLPAGRVLLQSPAAGTSVRRGWDLAVAESLGPQRVAIPDVAGKDERDAILLIRRNGLELGAIAELPDAQVKAGTVLAQDPGPHARGSSRPSVSLLVASPDPASAEGFVMPHVVGQPYAAVSAVLAKAGLQVASAAGAPPGAVVKLTPATAPGTIVAQTPPSGARVDSSVKIVLWTAGAQPVAQSGAQPGSKR
jgi:beta-lactam-binding protein with PASTA domain